MRPTKPNPLGAFLPTSSKVGQHCKYYVNGKACPFQNRASGCRDTHDLEARRANLAKETEHPSQTQTKNVVNATRTATNPGQSNPSIVNVTRKDITHSARPVLYTTSGNPHSTSKPSASMPPVNSGGSQKQIDKVTAQKSASLSKPNQAPTTATKASTPKVVVKITPNSSNARQNVVKAATRSAALPSRSYALVAADNADSASALIQKINNLTTSIRYIPKPQKSAGLATRTSNQVVRSPATGRQAALQHVQKEQALITTKVSQATTQGGSPTIRVHPIACGPMNEWDGSCTYWQIWAATCLSKDTAAAFNRPYLVALANGETLDFSAHMKGKASLPGTATEFPMFDFLPFELREMIWGFALAAMHSDCRVKYNYVLTGRNKDRYTQHKYIPRNATPIFLRVNHQSRELALKKYELAFGTDDSPPLCFFDFNNDRLFLQPNITVEYYNFIKNMPYSDRKRVRHLGIPFKDLHTAVQERQLIEVIAYSFKNLGRLYLVAGDGDEDAQWTRNEEEKAHIIRWAGRIWDRVIQRWHPDPLRECPKIEFMFIPAHVAHYYGIDGFRW